MKSSSKRRRLVMVALGVLVAVLIVLSILHTPAVPVETAEVTPGPLQVTVESPGRTRVVDRYTIAAPIGGRISRIAVREGDRLIQGQVIAQVEAAELDPRTSAEASAAAQASRSTAQAAAQAVQQAEAELRLTQADARRIAALAAEGAMSQQALEEARTREEVARRNLSGARERAAAALSDVRRAEATAGQGTSRGASRPVTAPSDGLVLRIPDRSERPVAAGEPLLEIGDARQIEVVADFLSEDAVRIRPGSPAILRDWGGPEPLEGRVRLVEPSGFTKVSALGIEEQRVNVVIDISNPPQTLGDGYRVDAVVVIWSDPEALRVPVSALGRKGDDWIVLAVNAGRADERRIRIGQRNNDFAQILEGLSAGDTVIVHPSAEIVDGTKVEPIQ